MDTDSAMHTGGTDSSIIQGSNAVTDNSKVESKLDGLASSVIALPVRETTTAEMQALHEAYARRSIVAIDQCINALTGGDPDETISARAARAAEQGKQWGVDMCKLLNHFQANHGPQAQAGDLARAEEVIALEKGSGALNVEQIKTAPEALQLLDDMSTEVDANAAKSPEEQAQPVQTCGHPEMVRGVPTGRTCKAELGHDEDAHQF